MKKVTIGLLVGGFVLVTSIGLATWASLPNADSGKATTALAKSAVGQTSTPLFLSTTQTPADTLPWTGAGVQAASTRYQGSVSGTRIYLGILGGVVEVIYSDGSSWAMGGSNGNAAFTAELPRGEQIRYVPQGATSRAPMGWRLLSQFVIIKN